MSDIKTHLIELDGKFEEMENIVARIDEQDHFANRAEVYLAVSDIGDKIQEAKRIIYLNIKEN